MSNNLDEYMKKPYTRILVLNETGFFSAEILEFPGCFAEGETPDEAIRNLDEAAKSWIEVSLEQKQEIPEPLMNQGYNGKIALRLPRSLHHKAVQMAELDDVSLNQFLVSAISLHIGAEDFYSRLANNLNRQIETNALFYFNIMIKNIFANTASKENRYQIPQISANEIKSFTAKTAQTLPQIFKNSEINWKVM